MRVHAYKIEVIIERYRMYIVTHLATATTELLKPKMFYKSLVI